jgi:magnesium-dependent phosphatase 1
MTIFERPKLIVFDLDNTLWTPELYQLERTPKAGKDIWLFDDVQEILFELSTDRVKWGNTRVAIASRTNKVEWAHGTIVLNFFPC